MITRFGSEKKLHLNRLFYILAATILVFLLSGCGQSTEKMPDANPSPFASTIEATQPTRSQAVEPFTSPLPTPDAKGQTLWERDPTPAPDLATVRGELALNGKPATGYTLYLAPIIQTGGAQGGEIAALDAVNDPRAEPDSTGYFHFINVQPGRYALGISSPIGAVLIRRGDTEIVIEAIQSQVVDLGTVRIVPFN